VGIKLSWDELIPTELNQKFLKICSNLHLIDQFEIPRSVIQSENIKTIELHGFCDASKSAYGAAIYIRSIDENNEVTVQLLCSKSRVAPLKPLTIPRLELCAAILLAKLASKVIKIVDVNIDESYFWSDSMVTLSWIAAVSTKWQSFVAHRVAEIQSLTKINQWHYVKTDQNPADLITRGMAPNEHDKLHLWFCGPSFLLQDKKQWPTLNEKIVQMDVPEQRKVALVSQSVQDDLPLFNKVSSYKRVKRIIGFCLRFVHNCTNPNNKNLGALSCGELQAANVAIVKIVQKQAFHREIDELRKGKQLSKNSHLIPLNAFLDENGLLRVGGRLQNAKINFDSKHQMLLPKSHIVTKLIIRDTHSTTLHSGTQATIAAVRSTFWPLAIKGTTKRIIYNCVRCRHTKPVQYFQLMGNLPTDRVTPSRPFQNCGVDYAGPILIKEGRGRGKRTTKSYVEVFVCLATKAIHLELVHDYTSQSFLNALKRMMARRGKVTRMYSDNGTNFVGANRELKEIGDFLRTKDFQNAVVDNLTNDGIEWRFIPPNSPHVGGIWEAGVKSFKNHFKRIAGTSLLTAEEMYTLLTLIEACLNSRPQRFGTVNARTLLNWHRPDRTSRI
jgi:hypothetical protein